MNQAPVNPPESAAALRERVALRARELAAGVANQSDSWFVSAVSGIERAYSATGNGIAALGRGAIRGLKRPFGGRDRETTQERVAALLMREVSRVNPELKGDDFQRFAEGIGVLVEHVVHGAIPVQDIAIVQDELDADAEAAAQEPDAKHDDAQETDAAQAAEPDAPYTPMSADEVLEAALENDPDMDDDDR